MLAGLGEGDGEGWGSASGESNRVLPCEYYLSQRWFGQLGLWWEPSIGANVRVMVKGRVRVRVRVRRQVFITRTIELGFTVFVTYEGTTRPALPKR